jgi:multidrug efflux pump subunit AcrA (membrane-fusion protein)
MDLLLEENKEGKGDRARRKFMPELRGLRFKYIVAAALAVLITGSVVAAAAIPAVRQIVTRWLGVGVAAGNSTKNQGEGEPAAFVRDSKGNTGLRLSDEAYRALRITPIEVKPAKEPRALPPQVGFVNYDNDRLFIIRSRFPGELAEVRQVQDLEASISPTQRRPLSSGDRVKQDDLLAVVWSQSLGAAKAALVDAIGSLRLSEDAFDRARKLFSEGNLALGSFKQYERQVQLDTNAMLTAERSLRFWKLTEKELDDIKAEAKNIAQEKKIRLLDDEMKWARVELRVPVYKVDPNDPKKPDPNIELTVVEKNTNLNDMVDPTNSGPLFKLADLTRLSLWVQPPVEYLSLLQERLNGRAGKPMKWKIRFQGGQANAPELELNISKIGHSIDANQHTGMIFGYLPNPDGKYRPGQLVTATIFLPPDEDSVEMPTDALNEVEGQSLVFVERDAGKREFIMRRVAVVRRFKEFTFVRSKLTPEEEKYSQAEVKRGKLPLQPLLPGERVITRGVVELTAALDELSTRETPFNHSEK